MRTIPAESPCFFRAAFQAAEKSQCGQTAIKDSSRARANDPDGLHDVQRRGECSEACLS